MLYYDRIDLSGGIDPAKSNNSKECIVSYYWFFNHEFKFQNSVCNGCHDLMMLFLNIGDIVIIIVKGLDYHCITHGTSKSGAILLLKLCAGRSWVYIKCMSKKLILKTKCTIIHVRLMNCCNRYQQHKAFEKETSKKLMLVTWHPSRSWDWCIPENEKKRNATNFY